MRSNYFSPDTEPALIVEMRCLQEEDLTDCLALWFLYWMSLLEASRVKIRWNGTVSHLSESKQTREKKNANQITKTHCTTPPHRHSDT